MNKEHIEKLEKKISSNARKIEDNASRIHKNTGALEILKTFKSDSQKFFVMWLITFISLLVAISYIIFTR